MSQFGKGIVVALAALTALLVRLWLIRIIKKKHRADAESPNGSAQTPPEEK